MLIFRLRGTLRVLEMPSQTTWIFKYFYSHLRYFIASSITKPLLQNSISRINKRLQFRIPKRLLEEIDSLTRRSNLDYVHTVSFSILSLRPSVHTKRFRETFPEVWWCSSQLNVALAFRIILQSAFYSFSNFLSTLPHWFCYSECLSTKCLFYLVDTISVVSLAIVY